MRIQIQLLFLMLIQIQLLFLIRIRIQHKKMCNQWPYEEFSGVENEKKIAQK